MSTSLCHLEVSQTAVCRNEGSNKLLTNCQNVIIIEKKGFILHQKNRTIAIHFTEHILVRIISAIHYLKTMIIEIPHSTFCRPPPSWTRTSYCFM